MPISDRGCVGIKRQRCPLTPFANSRKDRQASPVARHHPSCLQLSHGAGPSNSVTPQDIPATISASYSVSPIPRVRPGSRSRVLRNLMRSFFFAEGYMEMPASKASIAGSDDTVRWRPLTGADTSRQTGYCVASTSDCRDRQTRIAGQYPFRTPTWPD